MPDGSKTESGQPGSLHPAGSAESELWHEYLQSCGHSGYDGLCKCYRCQSVRDLFPKWKEERGRMQQNTEVSGGGPLAQPTKSADSRRPLD